MSFCTQNRTWVNPYQINQFLESSIVTNLRLSSNFHRKFLLQRKDAPENFSSPKQSCQEVLSFQIHLTPWMPDLNDFLAFSVTYVFTITIADDFKICYPYSFPPTINFWNVFWSTLNNVRDAGCQKLLKFTVVRIF